uniref:Uncharacterized protein n=1 Tax=Terrapene triunguis TaxID=2587831 RepID=A0A674IW38_9SAUR
MVTEQTDLLAVVATSALPQDEKTELEFVTLQFMMGGNVHLVGELQSQHTVEEFQQEVFARFPIPAFHVTSTVACNQVTSRRAERSLSLHELGCSGQQDRIYSQLIFFLCSASSLTHWVGLNRLLEMLQQLKRCIDYIPVALVGVIVQGDPELDLEQEVKALWWLKCLLDGVFCCDLLPGHEGTEQEVQVQVAVYQSGWPQRALEVKRAACQAIRAALNMNACDILTPCSFHPRGCFEYFEGKLKINALMLMELPTSVSPLPQINKLSCQFDHKVCNGFTALFFSYFSLLRG